MPKWTDSEIMMVGAGAVSFPAIEVTHWIACRDCVDGLHEFLRATNARMDTIERDPDLSGDGRSRQLADIASSALNELNKYAPLAKAERLVASRLDALKTKTSTLPGVPSTAAEISVASEVRRHIADHDNPVQFAWANMKDPRVVSAILSGPSFLSGLPDEIVNEIRAAAMNALHPEQVRETTELEGALKVCSQAVRAVQRMVAQRASMRQDADGIWRRNSDPQPKLVA